MKTWYISFADNEFLGAVIIDSDTPIGAIEEAWRLGINPGGEALVVEVEDGNLPQRVLDTRKNRLLSKGDIKNIRKTISN